MSAPSRSAAGWINTSLIRESSLHSCTAVDMLTADIALGGHIISLAVQDWDHAGSGGRYMAYKNKKLHEQFAETAARERAGWVPPTAEDATLFRGISIFVNGLTDPSHLVSQALAAS